MHLKRPIRTEEKQLILFLLSQAQLPAEDYPIAEQVEEYEGGVMGSIGLGEIDAVYAGDIIQVDYEDIDNTSVVITLTKDTNNRLLDLDFWKVDFSKLILYPTPEKVRLKNKDEPGANFYSL